VKAAASYPPEFWNTWGNGHVEVSFYNLTVRGKKQPVKGTAIASFRIGKFSNSRRVQTGSSSADVFPVMAMIIVKDAGPLQRETISVFAALEPVNELPMGTPTKVTFGRQSIDGQEWGQLLIHRKSASQVWHSFREVEGDGHRLLNYAPDMTVPEDALPLCARRIAHPILRLGQAAPAKVITSLANLPLKTAEVVLSMSQERRTTVVPAGSFRTHTFTAKGKNGITKTWEVETEPPHRIIRWQTSDGETGELAGTGPTSAGALSFQRELQ
jgi:hypothetical protein